MAITLNHQTGIIGAGFNSRVADRLWLAGGKAELFEISNDLGVVNVQNFDNQISINRHYDHESHPQNHGHYVVYGNLFYLDNLLWHHTPPYSYWTTSAAGVENVPAAESEANSEIEFAVTSMDFAGQLNDNRDTPISGLKLHPVAAEFQQGVEDELPPTPDAVVTANQLLTAAEEKARSHQFSVDVDGGISFIIVPADGTLISGELTTSGNIYAWHYGTDWQTELDGDGSMREISSLLGWLG